MYSEWKRTFCKVKDSFRNQKTLLLLVFVWMCVCTFWMAKSVSDDFRFLGIDTSAIDYMISHQEAAFSGIQIFPFLFFIGIKCKRNSLEVQYLLRCQTKKRMYQNQLRESFVYSVVSGGLLTMLSAVIGFWKSGMLLNWSSMESVYFYKTGGEILHGNFFILAGIIWIFYILKFMILFQIVDILLWFPKWLFLFWVIYLIPVVIEMAYVGIAFHRFFAVDYIFCKTPVMFAWFILLGIVILCIEYILGNKVIQKRDIWG